MKKLRRTVIILGVALLCAIVSIFKLRQDLRQAKQNVVVKEVVREVPGPVKIKYREIKQEPQIVEKIVYQDRVVEVPAPSPTPEPTMQPKQGYDRSQDRILAGVSIHGLGSDRSGHSFLAGYSVGNRIDILGGVSPQADTRYSLQAVYRFKWEK